MKRYQVYLNPHSVSILDEIEEGTRISRSKIIRDTLDRIAQQYAALTPLKTKSKKRYILDEMAGFIDLKTKKKTDFARHVDNIYPKV